MHAEYIWTDDHGEGLNRYALFRRSFELAGTPASCELHIFADTRYRLTVNGLTVAHGPARFFVAKPEYDMLDLAAYLREGENVIAVAVNSYGTYTYHSDYSRGGLIAWGSATDAAGAEVDLATGPEWKAIESPGHVNETCHESFVLNPGELLDARPMPEGWDAPGFDDADWPAAVTLSAQDHWGELHPRSIPLLDEREVLPRKRSHTWAARRPDAEDVYSFIAVGRDGTRWRIAAPTIAFTYIHSPRVQEVRLGAWSGRYWVNGDEVEPQPRSDVHMRSDLLVELREGWNTFQVVAPLLDGALEFYLGVPKVAELAVSAEKEPDSEHTFLVAGPWEGGRMGRARELDLPLASPDDLPEDMGPWRPWERGRTAESAFVERAWQVAQPIPAGSDIEVNGADHAGLVGDGSLVLTYDFGTEVLGRPAIDFSAAAGTRVDFMYAEKLQDGAPVHFHRYEVRLAERCIAREGRQTWRTFHPHGLRWLDVVVTGDLSRFRVHGVSLSRANYPVTQIGRFRCSDPTLNAIWDVGVDTLHACMEDAYLDCPRRERGSYGGDNLVQFYSDLAIYGDTLLVRRCLEQMFLAQGENGLIPPCAHSPWPGRHPDYCAITVQTLWHYHARTGDVEFLAEMKPRLLKLLDGMRSLYRPELDLVDPQDLDPYLDLSHTDREGVTCAFNCFFQRGFYDGARVLELLGDKDAAGEWNALAERMAASIRKRFWDESKGVFVDRLREDKPDTGPSVPANTLPLLFDIAGTEQAEGALGYVRDALAQNARVANPTRNEDFNVTSYFSFYALEVLYRHGLAAEAESFMRENWTRMLDKGAATCWEYFIDRYSQCHAWSTSPNHYLSTEVLGVRFPEPGDVNCVWIQPTPGTLSWAEGVYPHPAGEIRVRWEIKGDRLFLDYAAPTGVEIDVAGSGIE